MKGWIESLRRFQFFINELGLGGSTLAIASPKTLLLTDQSAEDHIPEALFSKLITEREIINVSRDLFEGGYYNLSVSEAFKALDLFIKTKVGESELSGTKLVQRVFSTSNPELVWTECKTLSEKDQQRGYNLLYQGGFTGIRNPTSHELDWINEPEEALDALMLAQHLLRKAKSAHPPAE